MTFTYDKSKSRANIDPSGTPQVRFPGSENFLPILTLKVLPINTIQTMKHFSRKTNVPPFSVQVFHYLLPQKNTICFASIQ